MLLYLFACSSLVVLNEAARILAVYPTPSLSHQSVFRVLTQELINQGHQVVVVTAIPEHQKGKSPKNQTEINIPDLTLKAWRERYIPKTTGKSDYLKQLWEKTLSLVAKGIDKSFDDEEIKDLANNHERYFDIVFLEAWIRPALIWSHIFKVPVIKVSSLGAIFDNYEAIGGPTHPLLYPSQLQHRIFNLTLFEKLQELYNNLNIQNMYDKFAIQENKMIRRHLGHDAPLLSELKENVQMLFLNVHPVFEGNRPVPLNVVHMGRLHLQPNKDLPKDLQSYLDSSQNGVIYMSFGGNFLTSMVPPELEQIFVKVLSQLPYDVLWKWHDIPGISNNIRISTWFPQNDLLHHPKIKLFITHGGLQSTDEAITAGVPLLGMPLAFDQWFNVDKYVEHNFGMKLDLETITEDEFRNAILNVIRNESYRNNIIKFRTLLTDVRHPALQRAICWSCHLLRHGHGALPRPAVTSLPHYLEMELLAIVAVCVIVILLLILFVFRFLIGYFLIW